MKEGRQEQEQNAEHRKSEQEMTQTNAQLRTEKPQENTNLLRIEESRVDFRGSNNRREMRCFNSERKKKEALRRAKGQQRNMKSDT